MVKRGVIVAAGMMVVGSAALAQPLPPVPVPPQNPITEAKRVLGKILFWDEQLSSDNTMACATCHIPGIGGSDARRRRTVGFDGILNTPDDVFGSPGVIQADSIGNYLKSAQFGLGTQATGRSSPDFMNAAYAPQSFWDGRASGEFRDPLTNAVLIPAGGSLESQAVGPIVSSVEMAHLNRNWNEVTTKLQGVRPLGLARGLQADVAAALTPTTTYGSLFQAAFGDPLVTPSRIAFAIATYERTLYPNDTPFDRTQNGQAGGLTPQQQQGFQAFQASNCNACHVPPQFTGNGFRNIGLRPPQEDTGQQAITGNAVDAGKFKVPSLRNAGLKATFMHNGMFTTIGQVIGFYARAPGAAPQFPQNQDPLMATVNVPPQAATVITDFVVNGLRDARVANQTFPFDVATLWSARTTDHVVIVGGGSGGSGGLVPQMIAATPPMIGNDDFKLGVQGTLGGASARLLMSTKPPVAGVIEGEMELGPIVLNDIGAGNGYGTVQWDIPNNGALAGRTFFYQWIVNDAGAVGGVARSPVAQATFFCAGVGCAPVCAADLDNGWAAGIPDGTTDINDLLYFLVNFEGGSGVVDLDNGSGTGVKDSAVDISDLLFFLVRFEQGC